MPLELPWQAQAQVLGVHALVYFFDPASVDAAPDYVDRQLPVLAHARGAKRPELLTSSARPSRYSVGGLQAWPDAVFSHGQGLLCLVSGPGQRSPGQRHEAQRPLAAAAPFDPGRWREQLQPELVLHCLATAMAVSGQSQRVTAALWRGHNVLVQLDPNVDVLQCLADHIDAARRYWNSPQRVDAAQLASFCAPLLVRAATRG